MAVALVTGGGGEGSGRAIARRFAREGAHVVVCDVDDNAGQRTVHTIVRNGGKASFRHLDVRSREEIAAAYAYIRGIGELVAVVNDASDVSDYHPEAPLDYWAEIVETDFLGAMWSTRFAIDAMRDSGGGGIVNVSSTSALRERAEGGSPMYDVAKLAILRLSLRLAFLRSENIRVNCIIPHWIAVPHIVEYVKGLTPQQRLERGVPGRLIPVDEIADAAYRLASDQNIAGQAIIWPDGRAPIFYTSQST
jgi:NAD(P)-dependent dehydrogenase (short-subunit alcohol dehydrogenase family)